MSLEASLSLRPLTLRHQRQRDIFRLQEAICRGFRDFLHTQGFTEIHTPKIVSAGAEGGSNIFRLDYFGRKAFLAQSPQFYKQMMVGVFERVFEVGPVFRAEKHSTVRHLNEYTSLDFEMGFIDSFHDLMNMETAMLQHTLDLMSREYAAELARLQINLPDAGAIPALTFTEAKNRVAERYGRPIKDPYDLEPEEERLIGEMVKAEMGSDFVFITHYPSKKRPFYAKDDPENPRFTLSFDLLCRGLEVTTGGQRIHEYEAQVAKMLDRGMNPDDFTSYLMIHDYGMPPHGGLGIGLERLLLTILGEHNIRQTVLFPRDLARLDP
jgi:nondiscriminating aspartyl-tRNA synthetase